MRFFGLDVHLDFCEVAVAEGGRVVVCNAADTRAISHARVKSDRL